MSIKKVSRQASEVIGYIWHSGVPEGLDFVNVWRQTLNSKRVEK
jgi:hypothetical protein